MAEISLISSEMKEGIGVTLDADPIECIEFSQQVKTTI